MSDIRLGKTDLLNRNWFTSVNGFDMRFPGARKGPVGSEVRKTNHANAAEASRSRATQPGKPA
jgi:hypothetical protein